MPLAQLALLGLLPLPVAAQVQKERARTPQAVALQIGDRRYEALHWGKAMGLGQNGGFVTASEAGSGQVLWILRIYRMADEDEREGDKRDVFITALEATADGQALVVRNERRQAFKLDLQTLRVSPWQP